MTDGAQETLPDGCSYKHIQQYACRQTPKGEMKCETIKRIFRTCPGRGTEELVKPPRNVGESGSATEFQHGRGKDGGTWVPVDDHDLPGHEGSIFGDLGGGFGSAFGGGGGHGFGSNEGRSPFDAMDELLDNMLNRSGFGGFGAFGREGFSIPQQPRHWGTEGGERQWGRRRGHQMPSRGSDPAYNNGDSTEI